MIFNESERKFPRGEYWLEKNRIFFGNFWKINWYTCHKSDKKTGFWKPSRKLKISEILKTQKTNYLRFPDVDCIWKHSYLSYLGLIEDTFPYIWINRLTFSCFFSIFVYIVFFFVRREMWDVWLLLLLLLCHLIVSHALFAHEYLQMCPKWRMIVNGTQYFSFFRERMSKFCPRA